jgi:hypothetical protein
MTDRHDRSRRFVRAAFPWNEPPSDDLLMEAAESVRVTFRLSRETSASIPILMALAASNMLLRLPVRVRFAVPDLHFEAVPPAPYAGHSLQSALSSVAERLGVAVDFVSPPANGGPSILIEGPDSHIELWLGTQAWRAKLSREPLAVAGDGNALAAYATSALATAEVSRAWARACAHRGGLTTEPLSRVARATESSTINLWRPGTLEMGPSLANLHVPALDWVGGGAVTQAALCVLAAVPNLSLSGRVFDPKEIDQPDLNRSVLAFMDSIDLPKPEAIRSVLLQNDLTFINSAYPPSGDVGPWVICGADDVSVRPKCQSFWPDRLVIIATEDQFAQVSHHTPTDGYFCGGCFAQAPVSSEPAATIVSTSVLAGVFGAATILRLSMGGEIPGRTDILTMRMDAPTAVSEVNPSPNPACAVCGGRRRAS